MVSDFDLIGSAPGFQGGGSGLFSRFFIDRPIFASVLSIVVTLAGGIAVWTLPLALYPPISPPVVQVDCNYPGASAQVVSETVATPIEQQVNGVENMMYMSSQCTNDGTYNLTVTFKHGIDVNLAQVLVQNRVALALPQLPDVLKQTGVNVKKKAPDILLVIALNSPRTGKWPNGRFDQLFLSNYAVLQVKDELARLPGVSDVNMLGQRDYSMRVWVDPEKLAARDMTAGDVALAVRSQNAQVATGQVGQPPVPDGQLIQVPLSTLGRLSEVDQFENIIVKATADGRVVRLKDVARIELGAKNQDISGKVNGLPSVSMAIFQLPDANALDTAVIVKDKVKELSKEFPEGMQFEIRYDTTPFISESIGEVFKTLREAIILVAIVVLVFLQNWRSAVIPLIAVPVAIIGTFAVMAVMGFSLNNLTLFGLVLAIGIVVDDAIVVVEAVEHHIEHGMSPRDATVRAMDEVSGPVIAIGLVLSAVFVPCAFITGIVGQFFRQFALTIAASTIISAFNSLTLSPALAAMLLRPRTKHTRNEVLPRAAYAMAGGWLGLLYLSPWLSAHAPSPATLPLGRGWLAADAASVAAGAVVGWLLARPMDRLLGGFFWLFNFGFVYSTNVYARVVAGMLRLSALVLVVYGGLLGMTYWGFHTTPTGFIPSQDMGYLLINVQLPDSASQERSTAALDHIVNVARKEPGTRFTQAMTGQSMLLGANGSNFGTMFLILDPYDQRPDPVSERFFKWWQWTELEDRVRGWLKKPPGKPNETVLEARVRKWFGLPKIRALNSEALAQALRARFEAEVPEAMITVLGPPPVRGVGRAGGFKVMIEDRGDNGPVVLQGQTEALAETLKQQKTAEGLPALVGLTSVFRANVPSVYVDVNRTECMSKDVPLKDLFDTMRIYLGSLYVNDFNLFGRTWQVVVQAEPRFRNKVDDVRRLKVRNTQGAMVPLGALAEVKEVNGPLVLARYNMYPAAPLNGAAAPGVSSGEAIEIVKQVARNPQYGLLGSMDFEWTELAYLELQAGNTAMIVFGFAVVMVFLVLAAQYESWAMPLAIILVVPMCLLSALGGVRATFSDINIFTQIGFVVLVGLASKNAILIVEFAKMRRAEGETREQAALDACVLRLRPIVMTSLAFILGVLPLILGQGAGAEMRRTLGTTVFSGMLGVTIFGLVLTPVFFVVTDSIGSARMFSAGPLRRLSDTIFGVVKFRWVPPMLRALKARSEPEDPSPSVKTREHIAANGNGDGHTNGLGSVNGNGVDHPPAAVSDADRN